jgi:hypothetical protein
MPADVRQGGVIGVAKLVDVVYDSESEWAILGMWHWVLTDPRPLPFQAHKGQLGLFDVDCKYVR